MAPLFSIVIPTYNRAEMLRRALGSIAAQTCQDFEVIVCDDGSTDDTPRVVASFENKMPLRYFRENNWGGPARPRNAGLRAARGEWICFLDADDWWYPEKLEVASRYLDGSDILFHDLDVHPRKFWRFISKVRGRNLQHPVFSDLMIKSNAIAASSVVIRNSMVENACGFSEDRALIGMEDFDLWLKVARMTERFTYIPRSLGAYWFGSDNLSEVSARQISRFAAIYDRHASYLEPDERMQAEMLLHYSIARIKQQMGLFEEARTLFRSSARIRHLKWRLMSRTMLALIGCRAILPEHWVRI